MVQVNCIGGILDSSGYSVHTRNLANALSKVCDVKLTSSIPQNMVTQLSDNEVTMLKKPNKGEINLIITSPIYWKLHTNAKRNWVFLVWEGDKIPKSFLNECMNPDIEYIFCPSNHTRDAIISTIPEEQIGSEEIQKYAKLYDKIKLIPHGVDLSLFYPKDKPDIFTFLVNKGWRNLEDRGGTQYTIKAYLEEFKPEDNCQMYVKINPAYGIPDINKMIEELKPDKPLPRLVINIDNIPYNKLVDLYNQCHVLVSPTRAESFNIPCIEAMACGLPVITTNFGGQTDFCNEDNGWIIGGELEEVKHEIMYENCRWLTPSIIELRRAMRDAYNRHNLKERSNNAINKAKEFTWDKTASLIHSLI